MSGPIIGTLYIALQRALPARLLGRVTYTLARSRNRALKDLLINAFVRLYAVDTSEAAAAVPSGYDSFNAFFTRSLQPGARPVDPDPSQLLSPADGTIQQIGVLRGDEILQVKGQTYSASELLGDDADAAAKYRDGSFVTIYLAPWNYHRVHMPATGRVLRMTLVPGRLLSVNATTAERVPRLFARNERVICHCEADWGSFAVVLVGAMNVGSISTAWAGEVLPRRDYSVTSRVYGPTDGATRLDRGGLLGQFNMGSTVILLLPPGKITWRDELAAGVPVLVGAALGRLCRSTAGP